MKSKSKGKKGFELAIHKDLYIKNCAHQMSSAFYYVVNRKEETIYTDLNKVLSYGSKASDFIHLYGDDYLNAKYNDYQIACLYLRWLELGNFT